MPKPVSRTRPVAESTSTLAGLMSLWISPRPWSWPSALDRAMASRRNCPISMGCRTRRSRGVASGVLDNQHRLSALAREIHWPHCPRGVQVLSKFVFVCEAIDALEGRVLSAGRDGDERVPAAVGIIPP